MSSAERLRTFLAVYRAGSVTNGARQRGMTQPAASQQIAALERAVGAPLFTRVAGGVRPTGRGRELYAEVAPSLDTLEPLLASVDGGRATGRPAPIRIATTAEYFSARLLPHLGPHSHQVSARFGDAAEALSWLETGEADLAWTPFDPTRRQFATVPAGTEGFALVCASRLAPSTPLGSLAEVATWLEGRPWVAYSHELPITRRFWQRTLGRTFTSPLALAAPDLRVVASAVAQGLGISLLPSFVVADLRDTGHLSELFPIEEFVERQTWFVSTLAGTRRTEIDGLLQSFGLPLSTTTMAR